VARDLSHRSAEHEMMDGGIGSFALFNESLKQIETVNRLTLGYRPILSWLERQLPRESEPVTILDIGCGRGDLLRRIWARGKKRHIPLHLIGVDIDPWSAPAARKATPAAMNINYRTGNAFSMNVAADFIICSHVTHHMTNAEIVDFINWLDTHAKRGWMIADLHRHVIPYIFAKFLLFFAPVNPMVRNDGAVSVARAFTRTDWELILAKAGVAAEIRWRFPFRYSISAKGPSPSGRGRTQSVRERARN
jgi:SAM-dependent methyltransferase